MRESCIECPAYNGLFCKIKKNEESAVGKLGNPKDKKTYNETPAMRTSRITNHFETLRNIRLTAYKARKAHECHLNNYVAEIISDEVEV